MRSPTVLGRIAGGIALILTMLAALLTAPAAVAQTGDSSIEVHARICPEGYQGQNFFEDCHDNVPDPGLQFTFSDGVTRQDTTNEQGNVGFANLPAGTYSITGGAPGEFTNYTVYCSVGTEAESNQEQIPVEYITGGIQLDLPADTNVICDWYIIPQGQQGAPTPTPTAAEQFGDATIEIHNRICPPGYTGENYFEDCHGNPPEPGLQFTLTDGVTREGTTNAEGNVGFANLPARTYTITGGAPGEFAERVVYCAVGTEANPNQEQIPVEYVTGGIQLTLPADTNVICDWYSVPFDLQGDPTPTPTPTAEPDADTFDLPVYKLLCEDAPGTNATRDFVLMGTVPEGCEQFAGVTVTVTDGEGAVLGSCTTDAANACYITVPVGATVFATEDLATVPEGYAPLDGETHELTIEPATEASVLFVNVATQPEPDMFDLPIYKLLCQNDPGQSALQDFVTVGTVPDGCEQYAGASVTVTDGDGNVIGSCVTEANAPCYVTVPVGATVFATEDLTTVPEGYAPLQGETHELTIEPATEASVLFVNVNVQEEPTPTNTPTPEPTPTIAPTPTPVVEGMPLQIVEGSCDDLGDVLYELEDLTGPEADPTGDIQVVIAETSSSAVSVPLNELMANDNAIVAYSEDEMTPIACTPIAGTVNADGELVLGLREQNESEYTGIAYLAPEPNNPAVTGISVFVVEGLSEDEMPSTPAA